MRTDSKREWDRFTEHHADCRTCRRVLDTTDEKEESKLCGEGRELLNVARMHTREELERG